MTRSARISPASDGSERWQAAQPAPAPRAAAARRWRSGLAGAVKRTTAGVCRMTDMPCGMIGVIGGVARRPEVATMPGDGVRHAVRQVDAGVAEADAGDRRGQQHLAAGLVVARIGDRPRQELGDHLQRPDRPDVADRVGALIGRAQQRALGPRPAVVRNRRVRLERVAEHVEAGAAATAGGSVRVLSGSTMPSVGRR